MLAPGLPLTGFRQFLSFSVVGTSGFVVDMVALYDVTGQLGAGLVVNFTASRYVVFRGRGAGA